MLQMGHMMKVFPLSHTSFLWKHQHHYRVLIEDCPLH